MLWRTCRVAQVCQDAGAADSDEREPDSAALEFGAVGLDVPAAGDVGPSRQNNPVILSVMPDAAGDRPAGVCRINGRNAPRSPNAPVTRPRRAITAEAAHRASSQQDAHRRCERLAVGCNDKTAHSEQECDG